MTDLTGLSHGIDWFFGLRVSPTCNSQEGKEKKKTKSWGGGFVWILWAEGQRRLERKMIGEENEFETIGTSSGHRKLRDGREAHHFPESLGPWFFS